MCSANLYALYTIYYSLYRFFYFLFAKYYVLNCSKARNYKGFAVLNK